MKLFRHIGSRKQDHGTVIYRPARRRECVRLARLNVIAAGGAIDYLFGGIVPGVSAERLIAGGLAHPDGAHSYTRIIVADIGGKVRGMTLSYPAAFHMVTDEMHRFIPADRLEHFEDFFASRVDGSWFLDALAVDERWRGQGLGTGLVDQVRRQAEENGFSVASLIVWADNDGAIRLYRRMGFTVEKKIPLAAHPLMPHEGGCLLMKWEF